MMRTLVDIDEAQVRELDGIAEKSNQSRAALIRQAIADFLNKGRRGAAADAFGLWGKRKVDGLTYQEQVRDEW